MYNHFITQYTKNKNINVIKELLRQKFINSNIIGGNINLSSASYFVYTDGGALNNGKHNAVAGIGIHFSDNLFPDISSHIDDYKQTNNVAELLAIIIALQYIIPLIQQNPNLTFIIFTDSEYAIKCANNYGYKQHTKNWKDDIPNRDLVYYLFYLYQLSINNINLQHIRAHTNKNDIHSKGNEIADNLVKEGIAKSKYYKQPNFINKIYINVPYAKKNIAKQYGAMWDSKKKKWYFIETLNNDKKQQLLQLFTVV